MSGLPRFEYPFLQMLTGIIEISYFAGLVHQNNFARERVSLVTESSQIGRQPEHATSVVYQRGCYVGMRL